MRMTKVVFVTLSLVLVYISKMRVRKFTFTLFSAAVLLFGSAAIAQADQIVFSGFRDFPVGAPAAPNPGLCGGGPPILRTTHLGNRELKLRVV